jgi:hypothetical protein
MQLRASWLSQQAILLKYINATGSVGIPADALVPYQILFSPRHLSKNLENSGIPVIRRHHNTKKSVLHI